MHETWDENVAALDRDKTIQTFRENAERATDMWNEAQRRAEAVTAVARGLVETLEELLAGGLTPVGTEERARAALARAGEVLG